jgi:hypothetical protein
MLVEVTVNSKEKNSQDFCPDYVQEFGLCRRSWIEDDAAETSHYTILTRKKNKGFFSFLQIRYFSLSHLVGCYETRP